MDANDFQPGSADPAGPAHPVSAPVETASPATVAASPAEASSASALSLHSPQITDLVEDWAMFLLLGSLLSFLLAFLFPVPMFVMTVIWVLAWTTCVYTHYEETHATKMLFCTPIWPMWFARKIGRLLQPAIRWYQQQPADQALSRTVLNALSSTSFAVDPAAAPMLASM